MYQTDNNALCREQLKQEMPVAAAADGEFREALAEGRGDDDFAAVYATVIKK